MRRQDAKLSANFRRLILLLGGRRARKDPEVARVHIMLRVECVEGRIGAQFLETGDMSGIELGGGGIESCKVGLRSQMIIEEVERVEVMGD